MKQVVLVGLLCVFAGGVAALGLRLAPEPGESERATTSTRVGMYDATKAVVPIVLYVGAALAAIGALGLMVETL